MFIARFQHAPENGAKHREGAHRQCDAPMHCYSVSASRHWDTNALVFRGLVAALGASARHDYDMNSLAVPRKAQERCVPDCKEACACERGVHQIYTTSLAVDVLRKAQQISTPACFSGTVCKALTQGSSEEGLLQAGLGEEEDGWFA
eukprot:1147666-Pelagomonas_calceolata.AAC.9